MDTKILEYLIAVSERKSISAAADLYYLSQPVLSRHIQTAEERIGAKLFIRKKGEMVLTDAGKIYMTGARAILYAEQKLNQELSDMYREQKHTFRLLVDPDLRSYFNRFISAELQNLLGKRDLIIGEGTVYVADEALSSHTADFVLVRSTPSKDKKIEKWVLFQDEIVMAIPASFVKDEAYRHENLAALQNRPFFMERSDRVMRRQEQQAINALGLKPWLVRELSGSAIIRDMVYEQKGIAFLPASLCTPCSKEIVTIPLNQLIEIQFCTSSDRLLSDVDIKMIELMRTRFQGWEQYLAGQSPQHRE